MKKRAKLQTFNHSSKLSGSGIEALGSCMINSVELKKRKIMLKMQRYEKWILIEKMEAQMIKLVKNSRNKML